MGARCFACTPPRTRWRMSCFHMSCDHWEDRFCQLLWHSAGSNFEEAYAQKLQADQRRTAGNFYGALPLFSRLWAGASGKCLCQSSGEAVKTIAETPIVLSRHRWTYPHDIPMVGPIRKWNGNWPELRNRPTNSKSINGSRTNPEFGRSKFLLWEAMASVGPK